MLSITQLLSLSSVYLIGLILILHLSYRHFRTNGFSFYLVFTAIYLLLFYLGYPFSIILNVYFNVELPPFTMLFAVLFSATLFYVLFYIAYQLKLMPKTDRTLIASVNFPSKQIEKEERDKKLAMITAILLLVIGVGSMIGFYVMNGLLLFKLESYSQIFSQQVQGVALKRFFYFFIPALLLFYFLRPNRKNWLIFLFVGVTLGGISYLIVGGTRANIALAVALFFFIGFSRQYIGLKSVMFAALLAIPAMFSLAMLRYGLNVSGSEKFYTFLYLTRDTFSPWENLAIIFNHYQQIEWQGIAPIWRDFYVYIPVSLWQDRPDQIVNSANYFTWNILHYHAGLAISPTLLGSLFIMGGVPMMLLGAGITGWLIKGFDRIYFYAKSHISGSSAILNTICFANLFNLIVLVREGLDAFISRFVFFNLIFLLCLLTAAIILLLWQKVRLKI